MKRDSNQLPIMIRAAARHLVDGYKACITEYHAQRPLELRVDREAPETYAALCLDAENGVLRVTDAHSATSIYGVAGNITFRVFHDYGHLIYERRFVTRDEIALAIHQWSELAPRIPQEWREFCRLVYLADTVCQSVYQERTGEFPADQRKFVLDVVAKLGAAS